MSKAIVLNSGGVDSTTCVAVAVDSKKYDEIITASIYYGQKHSKELECAKKIAKYYNLEHIELDLSNIFSFSNCSLLKDSTESIPSKSYSEQIAENGEGKVSTYVPFRNGLMLSALASFAQSKFPDDDVDIYIGAHADDAAGNAYADCSFHFIDAMDEAISIGTYGKVHIQAPFVTYNKAQVVATGYKLHVPYELTWSCYRGDDKQCGTCGTCIDRRNAFRANGLQDPVEYTVEYKEVTE